MEIQRLIRGYLRRQKAIAYFKANLDESVILTEKASKKSDSIAVQLIENQITVNIPWSQDDPDRLPYLSFLNSYGLEKVSESTGMSQIRLIKNGRLFFGNHHFHEKNYKEAALLANLAAHRLMIRDFKDWFMTTGQPNT